jgi:uncharacterized lipoprotein YmbA
LITVLQGGSSGTSAPSKRRRVLQEGPRSEVPASYRVEVIVDRFEGMHGDSVLLKAQWALFTRNRSMLLKRESLIREWINGGSYDALVGAMSGALEKLSGDISGGILSVLPPEAPR